MFTATFAAWSLTQEAQPASDGAGAFPLAVVAAALIVWLIVWLRRKRVLEAYFATLDLTNLGDGLPPSLKPPTIAWMPEYTVLNCHHGIRNGFEVAIFKIRMPQGESSYDRSMVAVRRTNFEPKLDMVREVAVTVDSTSTPEWIIASFKGGYRNPAVLEDILRALTAASG